MPKCGNCVKSFFKVNEDYSIQETVVDVNRPAICPGGYSLIWAMWGRAAGQGMVFGLAVLNRVYNLTCLCPKQGMVLRAVRL